MPSSPGENLTDIRAIVTISDGACFLTGSEDGAIRMWTTEPLGRVQAKRAHHGGTFALAAVGDRTAFSAGGDGRVMRWQLTPNGFASRIDVAALRSDEALRALVVRGDSVAAGGDDGHVRLHDLARDRSFAVDAGFGIRALAFTRDGRTLAAAGTRRGVGAVRAWRVLQNGLREVAELDVPGCRTIRCLLGVDGEVLLGGDDGVLRLWNWTADTLEAFDAGHTGPIHALVWAGERSVVSGGADGMALRWNMANRTSFRSEKLAFSGGVLALAVPANPDSAMVFAAGGRGEIRVIRHGEPVERPFSGHSAAVRAIAVGDGGDLVVTGSADHTARMWGVDGKPEPIHIQCEGPISAVAIWPGDDSRIVTACETGEITVWDRYDGTEVYGPFFHGARVWAVAVSPDGERILSGGNDGTVAIWNVHNGRTPASRWPSSIRAVAALAISGDGERVVIGGDDGTVSFRSLRHRLRPAISVDAVEGGQVSSVAVDHGGALAAVGGQDGRVTLMDPRTGERLRTITTGHRDVRAVLLSTSDSTVVTCGRDGTIERWDYRNGVRVGSVPWDLSGVVESIALMPDGKVIIAGGSAGDLDLVHTRPEQEEPGIGGGEDPDDPDAPPAATGDDPHPYLVGDDAAHNDTIGNGQDVRMLAHLLAARHTAAPLSVALVGDWGVGKTSTMVQVLDRVAALSASVADDDSNPFWARHIRQVRFNAWHYSDDHLWTGLVEQIMDGLRPADDPHDPQRSREQLRDRQSHLEAARAALADSVSRSGRAWWWLGGAGRRVRGLGQALAETAHLQVDSTRDGLRDVGKRFRNRANPALAVGAVLVAVFAVLAVVGRGWLPDAVQWLWSTSMAVVGIGLAATAAAKRFATTVENISVSLNTEIDAELALANADLCAVDPVAELAEVLRRVTGPNRYQGYRGLTGTVHRDLRDLAAVLARAHTDPTAPAAGVPERVILYVDDLDRCPPDRVVHVLQAVNLLMTLPVFIAVVTVEPPSLLRALDVFHSPTTTDPRQLRTLALALLDKVFNLVFALRPLAERAPDYLTTLLADLAPTHAPHPLRQTPSPPSQDPVRPDPPKPVPPPPAAAPLGPDHDSPQTTPLRDRPQTDHDRAGTAHASRRTEPLARAHQLPPPEPGYRPGGERLRMTQEETALLRALTSLLPGPRAVKKLTNVYRLILAEEYHRRSHFQTRGYPAAAIMAAALIHAPEAFPALIDRLHNSPCDHASRTHTDIRSVLDPNFVSPDLGAHDLADVEPGPGPAPAAPASGPELADVAHRSVDYPDSAESSSADRTVVVLNGRDPSAAAGPGRSGLAGHALGEGRLEVPSPALSECLSGLLATDPTFTRCAEDYRDWSVRVARFGFETYRYFTAG